MTEDTLSELRNRYAAPEIPKCSICGGELSIQRSGGGSPTVWACSGMIDDPTGERTWVYAEGRSMADEHYEHSRWTDYRRGGDSDVIDLINAYQSLSAQSECPALVLPDGWKLVPVEPTEDMVIRGFESAPDELFSEPKVWADYDAMSGCQQAAHRALLCWQAMLSAAPAVPHIAPIEPICASGGTEWVKLTLEQAKKIYRDLDACQKVIHYARGFDPSYVTDAQDCLKIIDDALAATPEVE